MYATNDNLQAIESRNRVRDTLLALIKKYPYKDITITQICQEAQMVRQTYYRNFDQKNDILKYHLDSMVQQFYDDYYNRNDIHAQLREFFGFMLLNKEFLQLASRNSLFFMINDAITTNITKFLNMQQLTAIAEPNAEKYVAGFIASTICCLLSMWVDSGFTESPEKMSQLAQKFLSGLSREEN